MSFQIVEGDVTIRDSSGNELAIADAALLSSTKGLIVAGSDGTNARFVKVATDGTVAISAVSLPLPTGAATEATLVSLEGKDFATETTLAAILADTASLDAKFDVNLSTRASEATLSSIDGKDFATETTLAAVLADTASLDSKFDVNLSTRATEATLAALETKAATETTLASILADTASLDSKVDVNLSTRATEATVATLLTEAEFTTRINVQGQQTMAGSTPVVLPSDQTSIPVRVVTSSGDVTADIVTSGSRNAQSIEYPDALILLSKIAQQLELVVKHLQVITDEEEEPL